MSFVNNKDSYQPANLHSLISTFFVCCLDSRISTYAKPRISMLLVFVAKETGLNLSWSEIPDAFSHGVAKFQLDYIEERGGSVVDCLTQNQRVACSSLTKGDALCF